MFLLTITSRQGEHELWCQTRRQCRAVATEISRSESANVPLSKPGETKGPCDRSVTSAAVTLRTLVTALCEKKAPLCGGEGQSIVRVCLGSWRGEAKSWQCSYGTSPNPDHNVQWQEQVVIVSHSEKYCGLQCDIVPNNRSFNATSFTKPRPA